VQRTLGIGQAEGQHEHEKDREGQHEQRNAQQQIFALGSVFHSRFTIFLMGIYIDRTEYGVR